MSSSVRVFQAGPDPFGRMWQVSLLWIQNGIAIRHSDTVDVKFLLASDDERMEKIIALGHPDLLELSRGTGHPITDPWCMELAARHLRHMIETAEDMDKEVVACPAAAYAPQSNSSV